MKRRKRKLSLAYAQRIARGKKKGLTLSQARGHPKPKERYASKRALSPLETHKIKVALTEMLHGGKSLTATADSIGIPAERLQRILVERKLIKKRGSRWVAVNTRVPIRMYSNGREIEIIVPNSKSRSEIGRYMNAVRAFLQSNDPGELSEFIGKSVKDAARRVHPYETDPEALYQVTSTGSEAFEELYKYVL